MIGKLALLLVLAISWTAAQVNKLDYMNTFTADQDFLFKQKRVFQVLFHLSQPELQSELYQEGQAYSIEANRASYTNNDAVTEFLHRYEYGFLSQDAVYSIFYPRHREQTVAVFRMFYYAKDFDTFYKTSLFCRNRLNHDMFAYAFYLAVMHRSDTRYVRLPPLHEIMPHFFYNSEHLEKAHHFKQYGMFVANHSVGYDAYIIPYNYSNSYLADDYDYEQRLNYFTEDVGLNTYYFYLRNQYPFFLSSEEYGLSKNYRGLEYLYAIKHLFSRYNLERLSNDLGAVEDYDYSRPFYPGYQPSMSYPNGLQFLSRPADNFFPKNKFYDIWEVEEYESRISQAIDSGFVLTKDGKTTSIYTPLGIEILGSMLEGNVDSCNPMYYGDVEHMSRNILSFGFEPLSSNKLIPNTLEQFTTSLRDPAFWRIQKKLTNFYYKYTRNLKPYKPEEIQFPELRIDSVSTDKLVTYFDYFDATISNGLLVASKQEAESYVIQTRQRRFNHNDFNIYINITAEKPTKAAFRFFLGPKFNVHNQEVDFQHIKNDFFELEYAIVDLNAGLNNIVHNSRDFFFAITDNEPSEVFYNRTLNAIEGGDVLKLQKRIAGYPDRLLLPKGKPEGMPFQLFVHVAPVQEKPFLYSSNAFGNLLLDRRPYGYPIDRPYVDYYFNGPNFYFKDVLIYHEDDHAVNVAL